MDKFLFVVFVSAIIALIASSSLLFLSAYYSYKYPNKETQPYTCTYTPVFTSNGGFAVVPSCYPIEKKECK